MQTSFDFVLPPVELIAGVDEVGRGPLIGAVVAAAVILDPSKPISGLADSKKLSEKKRDALYPEIIDKALAWSLGRAEVEEIDQLNILHASMLAMRRAVLGLKIQPQHVMVDGNRCPDLPYPMTAVVKGDSKVAAIAAASIIAKVTRDREMQQLDVQYPGYGIAGHKGYPTQEHLQALTQLGITPLHRRSFGPVKRILAGEIA